MRIKIKNLFLALKDQGPWKRFYTNFFKTKNGRGIFYERSHLTMKGKEKVKYGHKDSALRASEAMEIKYGGHYSCYKCIFCDGYHVGKNRDYKQEQ